MFKFRSVRVLLLTLACLAGASAHASDTLVFSGSRASIDLDGSWEALPISGFTFNYPPPANGWRPEVVPSDQPACLDTPMGPYVPPVKDMLTADGTAFKRQDRIAAWFRRTIDPPATLPSGKRIVLHFDGMAFRSKTWLNGKLLGESVLGQIPQDYDVTSILKPGQPNELVVGLAGREAIVDIAQKSFIAPASGVMTGIWGDVSLRFIPRASIDDVFVHTSTRRKQIDIEATIANETPHARTFQVSAVVTDDVGRPQCDVGPEPVTVSAGQTATVTLTKTWIAPRLWSPGTPILYLAHVKLQDGAATVDEADQRFGFREFWIQGRDFYLNGTRTVLKRNSFLTALGGDSANAEREIRLTAGRPFNAIRLHLGFGNNGVLDACDRFGIMTTPEMAMYGGAGVYSFDRSSVWLPNFLKYERAYIRMNRSRPSVVIWNLCNETFWGNTDSTRMGIADQMLATARAADPTRPQEGDGEVDWGGRLPIINIHYPEGSAGMLRAKYPDSGLIIPNDLYWLTQNPGGEVHSWRADFTWDRPLMIGEYWDAEGGIDDLTAFMGEEPYDWEKWRMEDFAGRDNQEPNGFTDALKKMTDVYRLTGVAGINPWSGDRQAIMPTVEVRPIDFHPNFYGGQTGVRKVVVFDDSNQSFTYPALQCRLTVDGATVWQKLIDLSLTSGVPLTVDIPIDCPVVTSPAKAVLTVRMRHQLGGSWFDLSRYDETIYIMPQARWNGPAPDGVVLMDSSGSTAQALRKLGLDIAPRTSVSASDLANARLLIVGAGTDASSDTQAIERFAEHGGRVLLLSVANPGALAPEMPEIDKQHIATRVWLRSHGAPELGGLEEPQFSYWAPDNIVCAETAYKPSSGKFKILLDAGGLFGLKWTPLVTVAHGAGEFVLSQMNLVDRIGVEPAADTLLLSLITSSLAPAPPAGQPMRILIGNNAPLMQTLQACSVVTSSGLAGNGPVFLDASYTPTSDEIAQIGAYLQSGGKVWLHGFDPSTIGRVAGLFPFTPRLAEIDKTVQSAARRSDDPWMDGISSFDFAWTRIDLGARGDYFAGGQPTASIGRYALVPPSLDAATELIAPGLLCKVPVGQGAILFDTLPWENALGSEIDKVGRIVSSLTLNLGGDISVAAEKSYSYFNVDLSSQANRGYYDEVAGDGRGGWTDQGDNDMRYFLINHTGKENGMEVATGNFPTKAEFAGRPFALVDPKANGGRAVIVLRGQGHDPAAPVSVNGIAIGHKADKLWFLQTACWAVDNQLRQVLGRYVIHYADGTSVDFDQHEGIELSDWWDPKPLPASKVGWSGKNDLHAPIGIYVTEWTNPQPDKEIASIDAVGNLAQAQIVLLGITGGVAETGPATAEAASGWDFTKAGADSLPNLVAGGPALAPPPGSQMPPADPAGGLHFAHGASLNGTLGAVPGLGDGTPWTLEASFRVDEKPDGYCGGIFEAMQYGKSGTRLVIDQGLKLTAEIFATDGKAHELTASSPLTLDRDYTVRVVFAASRAFLYVNNQLDAAIDSPPPAAYSGPIQVGRASGKDYNFNGSIQRIALVSSGG